jgi:hypothetical protein
MSSLDELEALVDELERRLDGDDWDGALPFAVTDEPLTAGDAGRARILMARLQVVEARLASELGAVRESLDDVARRRVAAASYRQ